MRSRASVSFSLHFLPGNVFSLLDIAMTSSRTSAEPVPVPGRALIVMGVSGSGKTTLGGRLASELGYRFIEGDDLHPAANVAKMSVGTPLTDDDRWPWLDRVAERVRVLHAGGCVISCSALKRVYRDHIRAQAGVAVTFVHPEVDRQILGFRMRDRPGHYMPPSLLESQLTTLERPGPDEGAIRLNGVLSLETLTKQVLTHLSAS